MSSQSKNHARCPYPPALFTIQFSINVSPQPVTHDDYDTVANKQGTQAPGARGEACTPPPASRAVILAATLNLVRLLR